MMLLLLEYLKKIFGLLSPKLQRETMSLDCYNDAMGSSVAIDRAFLTGSDPTCYVESSIGALPRFSTTENPTHKKSEKSAFRPRKDQ
jgi:hypothetical protein